MAARKANMAKQSQSELASMSAMAGFSFCDPSLGPKYEKSVEMLGAMLHASDFFEVFWFECFLLYSICMVLKKIACFRFLWYSFRCVVD